MINKPHKVCNQLRRPTLKAASFALCTTMLPLVGLARASTSAPRYLRHNASAPMAPAC